MKRFQRLRYISVASLVVYWLSFQATPAALAELADGTYTADYVVLQADKDNVSIANDYWDKPATVTIEGGMATIRLSINHSKWVTEFKVPDDSGGYVDTIVIESDQGSDTRLVEFAATSDFSKPITAKIHVTVPEIDYDHDYTIRLSFRLDSFELIAPATTGSKDTVPIAEAGASEASGADGGAAPSQQTAGGQQGAEQSRQEAADGGSTGLTGTSGNGQATGSGSNAEQAATNGGGQTTGSGSSTGQTATNGDSQASGSGSNAEQTATNGGSQASGSGSNAEQTAAIEGGVKQEAAGSGSGRWPDAADQAAGRSSGETSDSTPSGGDSRTAGVSAAVNASANSADSGADLTAIARSEAANNKTESGIASPEADEVSGAGAAEAGAASVTGQTDETTAVAAAATGARNEAMADAGSESGGERTSSSRLLLWAVLSVIVIAVVIAIIRMVRSLGNVSVRDNSGRDGGERYVHEQS